ncbi:MAG: hypothetical protein K9K32_03300 [Halanaerobiales bacterium]|nr:hypothetical protein [Halanaerobiales bacterium]
MKKKTLRGYLIRFSILHVVVYILIAFLFRNYLSYDKQFTSSVVYNNFRSYNSIILSFAPLLQLLRGLFIGLLVYPIYECIILRKNGWFKLFILLWGLSLIGSVAATPGSIEGFIYTDIPLVEHLFAIPEVTLQTFIFSVIFVYWEKKSKNISKNKGKNRSEDIDITNDKE